MEIATIDQSATQFTIDAGTIIGAVRLGVADLDRMVQFYTNVIGLKLQHQAADDAALGVGATALLHLERRVGRRDPKATGLYHFALLLPSRAELGRWLKHLHASGYSLSGASDHFVSEALYLSDPEGNGIEIYRDRPRDQWPHNADGSLQIGTVGLDLQALLGDAAPEAFTSLPEGTRMGHVHLQVHDVPETMNFYAKTLGFEVMDMWPQAGFAAAGGYHHHLGMNIWHSEGSAPPPAGSPGLIDYEIILPNPQAYHNLVEQLKQREHPLVERDRRCHLQDPAGITLVLRYNLPKQ